MDQILTYPPVNIANAYCGLDSNALVPLAQLPASVKDDLVTADATDPTAGHLDAKVDNATLEVYATTHVLRVKALGIADAQVATSAAIAWTKIDKTGAVAGDVAAQTSDADLTALAAFTGTAVIPERTAADTWAERTVNAPGRAWFTGTRSVVNNVTTGNLSAALSGTIYENTAAGAKPEFTLPAGAVGLEYTFIIMDSDGIRIRAPASTYIYIGSTASSAAGYIESTTVNSSITITCITTTQWVATSSVGTWSAA